MTIVPPTSSGQPVTAPATAPTPLATTPPTPPVTNVVTTVEAIRSAAERIRPLVLRTPLLASERLGDELGARVLVKAENLQHTGSFKVRGVFNTLLSWRERGELPTGVATFSAGNHAAAVSYAAGRVGLPAVVCMPPSAVRAKVDAVARYGGEIILTDDLVGTCRTVCEQRGYALLHPFDDPDVIAGQGTVGLEILADCAEPDLVVVPVGGGGLISGIAAAVKGLRPRTRVVGVEPATANALGHALRAGRPDPLPTRPVSLSDGLAAPFAGTRTLAHAQALVDEVVEVDEASIRDAWWSMVDATKLLLEPSAAVPLAAVRSGAVTVAEGSTVVFVLSGGNTSGVGTQSG
jgi:threonine dehydratase